MPEATSSGADARANGNAKNRDHNQGNQDKKYTLEQKAAVIRVRKCSQTAFYDILGLEEVKATVTDAEIKKAYRKLSLLTHPDKNGYEHADEAFKMVSRAFGVLSDPEKKAKYDRYGGDPDSRFRGGPTPAQNPFSGFAGRASGSSPRGNAGMWDEEISPEEMFNKFFGGGMGGDFGPFGTFGSGFGFRKAQNIFEAHDRMATEAFQRHDEMLRRFFH
jgi:DnaJ homolog subfamily B member 12